MTLEGETIGTGAPPRCPDCGVMPRIDVYHSAAGFYVGTWCDCGPYSRESGYFRHATDARRALDQGGYGRTTEFMEYCDLPGCPGARGDGPCARCDGS